jgi:ribosomal protein L11 methyltransferase
VVELTLLAGAASAEALSAALIDEAGALSVWIEDADAGTESERPIFGEPDVGASDPAWNRSVLKALFSNTTHATEAATRLLATGGFEVELHSIEGVADQDWVTLTQAQFAPVEITPDFWVVPSWHQPPAEARRVIRLDPGTAFGTGTHPTTRMCLRWIARHAGQGNSRWARVLDYGCGSGILAIGAARYGALSIDAVDIDPEAVTATAANAAANGVDLNAGAPQQAHGLYSLVLANILATPLKLLAPLLCKHLDSGADLVLAGILERQASDIAAAYQPFIDLAVDDNEDGWVLMTGRRPLTAPVPTGLHGMIPR